MKNKDRTTIEESLGGLDIEDDVDILDMIGVVGSSDEKKKTGGKRGKKHKSMQKWGKKGRKQRNKDPYGCHTDPHEGVFGSGGKKGLS